MTKATITDVYHTHGAQVAMDATPPCVSHVCLMQELLASMAPKKANWDLKREIEPRLAKLERRTQRALVEIMLEEEQKRMQLEGGVAD